MSVHSQGPHTVSCDDCGTETPAFSDMAVLMATIRGWDFDRTSGSHMCPDCGGTGEITGRDLAAEVERLTADLWACQTLLAASDRRIEAAIGMLDAELKYERNLGRHLSLTQISDALRGTDG